MPTSFVSSFSFEIYILRTPNILLPTKTGGIYKEFYSGSFYCLRCVQVVLETLIRFYYFFFDYTKRCVGEG